MKEDKIGGTFRTHGRVSFYANILVRRTEREKCLGKHWCIWKDNIRKHLAEIGYEIMDWSYLAQDTDQWWVHVNTAMDLEIP